MKKVKKRTVYFLCLILVTGCLSGCGGFVGKSDGELLMSSIASLNQAKSFEANGTLSGNMSMKMGEITEKDVVNIERSFILFAEPLKAKVRMKEDFLENETKMTESYVQKENNKYVVYEKVDDIWTKNCLETLDEAMNEVGSMEFIQKLLVEDVSKYTKQEDQIEGDKRYLVYEYKVAGDEQKNIVNGILSFMDSSLEADQLEAVMRKMDGNTIITIFFDRKSECISRIELSLTDMMNSMFKGLLEWSKQELSDTLEEEGVDEEYEEYVPNLDETEVTVSDMNLVVTYSKVDEAEDFTIPKEALKAKSEADLEALTEEEQREIMDEGTDDTEDEE